MNFVGKLSCLNSTILPKVVRANIEYKLSASQKVIAKQIFDEKKEIYVKAVCGAGKTECVFPSIEKALQQGKRVGFAIPRKEVVKEIYERLKDAFPNVDICAVYGGHHERLKGEIIVFTTHQSYRYENAFGLLIVDEYDAFPFKGNKILQHFLEKTCSQKKVYLSATFLKKELENKKTALLNKRFHYHNIPCPKVIICSLLKKIIITIHSIQKLKKDEVLFIFVPTIKQGDRLNKFLDFLKIKSVLFNSKSKNKEDVFSLIKNKIYKVIITTTILERGITLKNLNVIIFNAHHKVFDHRCLIQISGRVGRKKDNPSGYIIYLASKNTNEINKSIFDIQKSNSLIDDADMCNM